jgi:hypothetical protein
MRNVLLLPNRCSPIGSPIGGIENHHLSHVVKQPKPNNIWFILEKKNQHLVGGLENHITQWQSFHLVSVSLIFGPHMSYSHKNRILILSVMPDLLPFFLITGREQLSAVFFLLILVEHNLQIKEETTYT